MSCGELRSSGAYKNAFFIFISIPYYYFSITNFPKHAKIRNMFTETKNVFLNREDMCRTSKKFV